MKIIAKIGLMLVLTASLFTSCAGSYYVADRPAEPRYERPVAPYRNAVWIPGEWVWRGNGYQRIPGHWARPRYNHTFVEGHWRQTPRGYVWVKGYWQ